MTSVTPADIATELGRPTPATESQQHEQWQKWIMRAVRAIHTRAQQLSVPRESLDPDAVDDVVTYAVVRRATRSLDDPESTTDSLGVDDGTWSQTRRYGQPQGDVFILDEWWALLGLSQVHSGDWSGSIAYGGRQ